MTIWDGYGDWDAIAKNNSSEQIKNYITGDKKAWTPNFFSPALDYVFQYCKKEYKIKYSSDIIALDFGCGLGRNGPMLKSFFSDIIGFDRPEMINRLNSLDHALEEIPYRQTYTSFSDLVQEEKLGILYDSVVFQHIIDKNYLLDIFNLLNSMESFRTFVSIYNASVRPVHIEMLLEKNWRVWHTETETLSFEGSPHIVSVLRRW